MSATLPLDEGLVTELAGRIAPARLDEIRQYAAGAAARAEERGRGIHGAGPGLLEQLEEYAAAYLVVGGLLLRRAEELRGELPGPAEALEGGPEAAPAGRRRGRGLGHTESPEHEAAEPASAPARSAPRRKRRNQPPGPWSPPVPRVAAAPRVGAPAPMVAAPARALPTPEEILARRPTRPPARRPEGGSP